ncbi:MAG: hypothetical protein H0X33_11010 [Taibaiella sp.]|nr:hypothetical protein [Taibaiella sp.]
MIRKYVPGYLLLALLITFSTTVYAQPKLPDIAAGMQQGLIILTWDCQYDGIKSIAMQRSSDSLHNYSTVGYVRATKKGLQAFVDGHPLPGNNWYQLYILFGSGLTWNSNRLRIHVDSSVLLNQTMVLPPNDSLQKILITTEPSNQPVKSRSGIVVNIDSNGSGMQETKGGTQINMDAIKTTASSNSFPDAMKTTTSSEPGKSIRISIESEPLQLNPYSYIKSKYVYTNPLTGHINLDVPYIKEHHYAVKFYDEKNNLIFDVPRLMESPVIIDKRNFQRKGLYRFELIRDRSEFERGYITVY